MKDMSRAIRRHHAARLKRARRFYFAVYNAGDPRRLGLALHTPALCSCWMCGNARRYFGRTRAELVQLAQLAEEKR